MYSVDIQSGHRTYLTSTSEMLNYQDLANLIQLKPLKGWSKVDFMGKGKSKYKFSKISHEPFESEAYELENQLDLLLTELEKDSENVKLLTEKAETYISVCKNQYVSGNAGINFDTETIKRMATLNLSISIDTYIGGNPIKYEETVG